MRSDFENYIREQGYSSDFQLGPNGQYKSDVMHFMFTTWCYQQSKLDELQKQVGKAECKLHLVQECIEVNSYSNMRGGGLVIQASELEQVLKGEQDA
ncbi:hypothetical protein [Acinetobacter dispersus]|uniref:Uncharacterized protein n=1 Tax=Acinetobacter dispersus TaxID=70348 RepID=N9L8Z3_9GAMM|nr:hypothetical protein [Acinetobacter dispersus]ENW92773.1 hypothetical protein F904_02716 [Acinetobacter dispersus]